MKRIIALALILVALASLLAGCGKASDNPVGHYTLKEYSLHDGQMRHTSASLDINEDGTFTCFSYKGTWEQAEQISDGGYKYKFHVNGQTKTGHLNGDRLSLVDMWYDDSTGSIKTASAFFTR